MRKIRLDKTYNGDLEDIIKIEEECFKDRGILGYFSKSDIDKWYNHNRNMFYVVRSSNDRILGFMILTPVTERLYDKIIKGEVKDLVEFPSSDVCKEMQSDYYYVSDICISDKRVLEENVNKNAVFLNLLIGMNIMAASKFIAAYTITRYGQSLCEGIGFRQISFESNNNSIYELKVTPEKVKKFSRLTRVVK